MALLDQEIQSLVTSVRSYAEISVFSAQINTIASIISTFISSTETAMSSIDNEPSRTQSEPIIKPLFALRRHLLNAEIKGRKIARYEKGDQLYWMGEADWRGYLASEITGRKIARYEEGESLHWLDSLPPIAFDIAREMKNIVGVVDSILRGQED